MDFMLLLLLLQAGLHEEPKEFNPQKSVCLTKEDLAEMEDVFEYANHTDSFHQRKNPKTSMMMEATR